jgi:hypothetical protein
MSRNFRCGFPFFFASLCALLALSCGKNSDVPDNVPVSGKVTVDGDPVTAGQVSYIPYDKEQKTGGMSAGQIDSSGGYVIYTAGNSGAPPGRYKVTVTPSMVPSGDMKMPSIPFNPKYSDASKTPLIINVTAGAAAGTYDLKLTKK